MSFHQEIQFLEGKLAGLKALWLECSRLVKGQNLIQVKRVTFHPADVTQEERMKLMNLLLLSSLSFVMMVTFRKSKIIG